MGDYYIIVDDKQSAQMLYAKLTNSELKAEFEKDMLKHVNEAIQANDALKGVYEALGVSSLGVSVEDSTGKTVISSHSSESGAWGLSSSGNMAGVFAAVFGTWWVLIGFGNAGF